MNVFRDLKMIRWGLVMLSVMTVLGVMAAEQQINHLTERQSFVQSFNIVRGQDGTYLAYLLGEPHRVEESYPIGTISNSDQVLYVALGAKVFIVPYVYSFPIQPYFDELYELSLTLQPKFFEVKHRIDQDRQSVIAALKQFGRQLR